MTCSEKHAPITYDGEYSSPCPLCTTIARSDRLRTQLKRQDVLIKVLDERVTELQDAFLGPMTVAQELNRREKLATQTVIPLCQP